MSADLANRLTFSQTNRDRARASVITSVTLTDFRSYKRARLEPGAGVTALHGPMGAGEPMGWRHPAS